VGVDLQHDGAPVPGAAATSVAGATEFSHSDTTACSRSSGGDPAGSELRLGERDLPRVDLHGAVSGVLNDAAPCSLEDPPIGGGAVPLDVRGAA
jgi:hypothetical protein